MTNVNGRDDNDCPIIWGVSHIDGRTPIQVKFNPSTRSMMYDTVTNIGFNATINASVVPDNTSLAKATSSADDKTIRPWVVNASTGAVLVEE